MPLTSKNFKTSRNNFFKKNGNIDIPDHKK